MRKLGRRIGRLLSLRRLVYALTGVLFTLTLGVIGTALTSNIDLWVLPYLLGALGLSGGVSLVLYLLAHDEPVIPHISATCIRTPQEQRQYARRGLIVFVGLYNPFRSQTASALSPDQCLDAAMEGDYNTLDVMNSNLETTITAVLDHATALQHCWLISTAAQDRSIAGSHPYVKPIVEYLTREKGLQCRFHWEEHSIPLDDDASVCEKTYNMVRRIYQEADRLGIRLEEIVADFTTGVRSMTLGMVLATLSEQRDVQFMGTRYDYKAKPKGALFPVIFHFGPRLPGSEH